MPIYMQYGDVKGPVTAPCYIGWIELQSCNLGQNRHVTNSTGRGGNREPSVPSVSEITVTKLQDSSSTNLFRDSLQGTGKKVTIVFTRPNGSAYMQVELENTMISGFSASGHGTDAGKPIELFTLNFTKIEFKVAAEGQARIDQVRGGYDLGLLKGS